MRFYAIINMYLAGIHAGIQGGHVVHRTLLKYDDVRLGGTMNDEGTKRGDAAAMLKDWQRNHETMIVCNGGYASNMEAGLAIFKKHADNLGLAWGTFHESQEALYGIMTGIGIVLPPSLYGAVRAPEDGAGRVLWAYQATPESRVDTYDFGSPEHELLEWVRVQPLAK